MLTHLDRSPFGGVSGVSEAKASVDRAISLLTTMFKQFTWRYPGLSPVHLTLNVLAVIVWAAVSAGRKRRLESICVLTSFLIGFVGMWYKWQLEPVDTRLETVSVESLEYPTVIAVSPPSLPPPCWSH